MDGTYFPAGFGAGGAVTFTMIGAEYTTAGVSFGPASADTACTGTISGANVSATAGNLLNQGRIAANGTVELRAQQDLHNLGGQISGDVQATAGGPWTRLRTRAWSFTSA